MRIKQRLEDFRVRELLRPGYLLERGDWRVYRVTKKKLTSIEASRALAQEAGVPTGDVTMAGLKDRQGVTTQFMAIHRGREIKFASSDLRIESVGFADLELTSADSEGNTFEIVVRGLDRDDLETMRNNLPIVREQGVINYFDDQRFGNLRHGQGWIALELMRGEHESALKHLIATPSEADDPETKSFRSSLERSWGRWAECREIAGRFGQHHSVFEHLKKHDGDFAGAFFHVATRVRLIHLYAFQSHIWNRAVANLVRARTAIGERVAIDSEEGPLLHPLDRTKLADLGDAFRLPGPRLEDVKNPAQRRAIEEVLARDKIAAVDFDIRGVSGFQLKGEDRALFVAPSHLRIRPAEPDEMNPASSLVRIRFDLPRGAYATLVVRRLMSRPGSEERPEGAPRADFRERRTGSRDERFDRGSRDERSDRGPRNDRFDRPPRFERRDDRGSSSDRPRSDDRGPRSFGGDRPRSFGSDRRPRSFGGDRPRYDDRARPGGDDRSRPSRDSDRGPRNERPNFGGGPRPYSPRSDDRPRRGDRPNAPRPFERDRPNPKKPSDRKSDVRRDPPAAEGGATDAPLT